MLSFDSFHPQLTVNLETDECLEIVREILTDLKNIKVALENGEDPSHILFPPFDPFKTIGKYC